MTIIQTQEQVVLVSEDGTPKGTADKGTVHTEATPLHLAFSCYVYNQAGDLLLTRRSLNKRTWPGVWTNSFCGHPAPNETFENAITRRAEFELGISVSAVTPLLPDFRYRAIDASGIVENEICPVFTAVTTDEIRPNPLEVAELAWIALADLRIAAALTPFVFSPWLVLQLQQWRNAD